MHQILEQSDNYSWRYYISKNWGYRKYCNECSLGGYLVIDNYVYVPSDALPLYHILKQMLKQLAMEILHLKDMGDTESVVTNAVVLVLGGYQMSMATYLRGYHKVVLQCIGN